MIATNIREEARNSLKGKWKKSIIMLLIEALILGVVAVINNAIKESSLIKPVFALLETVIQVPLAFGLIHSFIKLKRNEDVEYFDFVKIGFSNFKKSWAICFRTLLKMIVPIICIIVAMCLIFTMFFVGGIAGIASGAGQQTLGLVILGILIYVVAIAYAVTIGLKYALSVYVAYDNLDMSAKEVVEKSEELMSGHRGDLFVLLLSFIGWALLCYVPVLFAILSCIIIPLVIIFGACAVVAILALGSYVSMAKVCFYDDILQLNSEKTTVEVQE